jgi:hypothetical protein
MEQKQAEMDRQEKTADKTGQNSNEPSAVFALLHCKYVSVNYRNPR